MASTSVAFDTPAPRAVARPGRCGLLIMAGDLSAVAVSLGAAVLIRYAFQGEFELSLYSRLFGVIVLFAASYAWFGLYPGVTYHAVRELRQLTLATTLVFVGLGTLSFLFKEGAEYSRIVFLMGWLLALALTPLSRVCLRSVFGRSPWWAYPVAIFGPEEAALQIARDLLDRPESGLRPAAIFIESPCDRHSPQPPESVAIPSATFHPSIFHGFRHAPLQVRRLGLKHAIIATPDINGPRLTRLLESYAHMFSHVFVVPGFNGFSSLCIETRDVCDTFALEVRRSLLSPGCQFTKRLIDQALCLLIGIFAIPLLLLLAVIIRLESSGPALYRHKRIGYGGRQFNIWKLRTMYKNGNGILEEYLRDHPEERQRWLLDRKLRNDPRVTRFGRVLRRSSLDELPQLWNVFIGEMSLVGPRPIVNGEVPKYGEFFDHYCRVAPGITGLWQVSGRSNTTYTRRVELDSYYVRNWSPWFDVYLLARTVRTVFERDGAY